MWQVPISQYEIQAGYLTPAFVSAMTAAGTIPVSRTSPAVADNVIYIGDQGTAYIANGNVVTPPVGGQGDHLFAINANNGQLMWSQTLDTHVAAIDTQSPVVYNGVVYVGSSSKEELFAGASATYPCCTFRGSIDAVSISSHQVLWRTYMTPANGGAPGGYSGAAVWSSTPAIDPSRNSVYLTTGNNYSVPASAKTCQDNGGTPSACLSADDHVDSIVALNLRTGAIQWATGTNQFDDFNASCLAGSIPQLTYAGNCPNNPGPDYDFGSGPMLTTISLNNQSKQVLIAGEKSGQVWEVDPATGSVIWGTQGGPGSPFGGIEWGTATDGKLIYIAEANGSQQPWVLTAGQYQGKTICTGFWAGIDPATGAVRWQTPDPGIQFANADGTCTYNPSNLSVDIGPVTTANGVVYVGSLTGNMYALRASDGSQLWSLKGAGASNAGPAIVNGVVYWGNGYFLGANSSTFYALSPGGQ
jgi:polyvinyl alcohol dehydrogenase (cytochrome)